MSTLALPPPLGKRAAFAPLPLQAESPRGSAGRYPPGAAQERGRTRGIGPPIRLPDEAVRLPDEDDEDDGVVMGDARFVGMKLSPRIGDLASTPTLLHHGPRRQRP